MSSMFHDGSRSLQDRFDTRRLADRIDQLLKHETIAPHEAEFIESQEGCETPVPNWKREDWARDVLAADDPAHDPNATVV